MPYFDRFDICEAHLALENDYNVSGILQERPSNQRRCMSTDYQLHRMGFRPGRNFNGFESLSENARDIYLDLVERYKLPAPSHAPGCLESGPALLCDYCRNNMIDSE